MNDDDIIAIIRQYLADLATSGQPSIGDDWAYDDYGLQNTLAYGGNPNLYPYEDWMDAGVDNQWGVTGGMGAGGDIAADPYITAPREMRPYWQPFRGYGGVAQLLHPASAPLVRRDFVPALGVGPVKVQQAQEGRKDTSKRRPLTQEKPPYVDERRPMQPEFQYTALPQRVVDTARTYAPSPVVRALVSAPIGTANAHNLFR